MVSIKPMFVYVAFLVLALSMAAGPAAAEKTATSDKVVSIGRISTTDDSGITIIVNLEANKRLSDSRLTVSFPGLGQWSRNNVDFSKKLKQSVRLEIQHPSEADPYVKIVFDSDEGRRVKYRPIITE